MRKLNRAPDQLRPVNFIRNFTKYAEGSILVSFGETKVLCTASVSKGVPSFLRDSNQGWLTAEYGMLPRATQDRVNREASRGKQQGRTIEIQRLIGRSLRAAIDLEAIKDFTISIDCDVLQADGGTRTAAITGSCVALIDALKFMQQKKLIEKNPLKHFIASASVGIINGTPMLDLDYAEDSHADTDMNVIMTDNGHFVEIQGTAEANVFSETELNQLLSLAKKGIHELIKLQKEILIDV